MTAAPHALAPSDPDYRYQGSEEERLMREKLQRDANELIARIAYVEGDMRVNIDALAHHNAVEVEQDDRTRELIKQVLLDEAFNLGNPAFRRWLHERGSSVGALTRDSDASLDRLQKGTSRNAGDDQAPETPPATETSASPTQQQQEPASLGTSAFTSWIDEDALLALTPFIGVIPMPKRTFMTGTPNAALGLSAPALQDVVQTIDEIVDGASFTVSAYRHSESGFAECGPFTSGSAFMSAVLLGTTSDAARIRAAFAVCFSDVPCFFLSHASTECVAVLARAFVVKGVPVAVECVVPTDLGAATGAQPSVSPGAASDGGVRWDAPVAAAVRSALRHVVDSAAFADRSFVALFRLDNNVPSEPSADDDDAEPVCPFAARLVGLGALEMRDYALWPFEELQAAAARVVFPSTGSAPSAAPGARGSIIMVRGGDAAGRLLRPAASSGSPASSSSAATSGHGSATATMVTARTIEHRLVPDRVVPATGAPTTTHADPVNGEAAAAAASSSLSPVQLAVLGASVGAVAAAVGTWALLRSGGSSRR